MKPDRTTTSSTQQTARAAADTESQPAAEPFEIANQRLMLYLKALRVPVHKRYALAEEALSRAAALHGGDGDIVAAAMRCLRDVVREDPQFRPSAQSGDLFADELAAVTSMPPMNRSSMIPVPLERTGPLKFFFPLFVKMLLAPLRPPLRIYVLVLLCAALAALYVWQRLGG